jgi:hypothetical protein
MADSDHSNSTHTPKRVPALGIFMVLFGIVLGVLTVATIVGPILGLILVGFGVFLIWKTVQGEPPETLP